MLKPVLSVLIILCLLPLDIIASDEPFILGADISWIPQREAGGVRYADNGVVKDVFEILKDHRFNWIRLRLFVDPTAVIPGEEESPYSPEGFCGLEKSREMAKRIKAAGMKFLLDFHYSDTWADPAKQYKPMSWSNLSFNQLTAKVRSYTRECLQAFKSDGTLPDMVQVGNEIVGGMIWPDGRINNMSNFAALVNAGIDGVKDVSSDIRIMIHSISENSPSNWLRNLKNAGVNRIDVFGLSYYSQWHGTTDNLKSMLTAVAANHNEKIVVVEYADNHERVNDIVFDLPDEKGLGTFVWEPCDWMDALFDWRNNRRETNSRIDIYPRLSEEYGNDDIVTADKDLSPALFDNSQRAVFRLGQDGVLRYFSQSPATVSIYTFQGRMAGQYRILSPGEIRFPVKNSGSYIMTIESGDLKYRSRITLKK